MRTTGRSAAVPNWTGLLLFPSNSAKTCVCDRSSPTIVCVRLHPHPYSGRNTRCTQPNKRDKEIRRERERGRGRSRARSESMWCRVITSRALFLFLPPVAGWPHFCVLTKWVLVFKTFAHLSNGDKKKGPSIRQAAAHSRPQ